MAGGSEKAAGHSSAPLARGQDECEHRVQRAQWKEVLSWVFPASVIPQQDFHSHVPSVAQVLELRV